MKYHIVEAVWGKEFTSFFLETHLPSLLAPGNLGYLASSADCTFHIYTTEEDLAKIRSHGSVHAVESIMKVEAVTLDYLFKAHEYSRPISILQMTRLYAMAAIRAGREDAAMIFPSPDTVISSGAFERVGRAVSSGNRAVMVASLRYVKDTLGPEIMDRFRRDDGCISASPRELIDVGLDHLHPMTNSLMIDSGLFAASPAKVLWKVEDEGLLARCLHMHPLMVWPRNMAATPFGAVDTDFLASACPDYDDYHIVTDSDELAVLELSARGKSGEPVREGGFRLLPFARYVSGHGGGIHRRLLRETIKLHRGMTTDKWREAERASERVVNQALALGRLAGLLRAG